MTERERKRERARARASESMFLHVRARQHLVPPHTRQTSFLLAAGVLSAEGRHGFVWTALHRVPDHLDTTAHIFRDCSMMITRTRPGPTVSCYGCRDCQQLVGGQSPSCACCLPRRSSPVRSIECGASPLTTVPFQSSGDMRYAAECMRHGQNITVHHGSCEKAPHFNQSNK